MFTFFKTVFGAICHLLAICLKIVYNILKFLRVRVLSLYLAVCGLLQLAFRLFEGYNAAYFYIGLGACCVVTLLSWIFFIRKRIRRKRVARDRKPPEETRERLSENARGQEPLFPRRYAVEGHKDYYFIEYEDRYELYFIGERGDEYVRTDYKQNGESL